MAKLTSVGSFFTLNLKGARKGEKWFLGEKKPIPKGSTEFGADGDPVLVF